MIATHTRRWCRSVGIPLVFLTASGCAAAAQQTAVPPAGVSTPTPRPEQVTQLRLPIEAYMLTPEQSAQRSWVRGRIVGDCAKEYGLDVKVGPKPDVSAADSIMFRRYGVTDPASVGTWGYHLPRRNTPSAAQAAALRPSAAEHTVLFGRDTANKPVTAFQGRSLPVGGCTGKANAQVDPGTSGAGAKDPGPGYGQLVATTKGDSFTHSMADTRVKAVFTRWSECMRTHGFNEPSPMEAGVKLPSIQRDKPDSTEINEARTDVACKLRTNLVGVWFAVESDYQNAAIARLPKEFAALRAERDAQAAHITRLARTYAG